MSLESTGGPATQGERRRYREIAVDLGFVTPEQIDEVTAKQEELGSAGVWTHTGDVLVDLGYLTAKQNEQILLQQSMQFVLAKLPKKRPLAAPVWVASALIPVTLVASPVAIAVCAVTLAIGGYVARTSPARWVALGWMAAVAAPGIPIAGLAAAGAAVRRPRNILKLAALVAATAVVPLLPFALSPGVLLLLAGAVMALWRWRKRQ